MSIPFRLLRRAETDLLTLQHGDQRLVLEVIEALQDFPLMARSAELTGAPEIRRAVAGDYLIFYEFDPTRNAIYGHSVLHGRRRPPTLDDIH